MIARFPLLPSLILAIASNLPAFADKAPLSISELQNEADAIVVATIERIRIESEPSRIERGFGNSDWGIYLTLNVMKVEKGNVSDKSMEARCFRIKSRRSTIERMTPSGHHPIPGVGTRVLAYLAQENGSWNVVLPNGITSVENVSEFRDQRFRDATEVQRLRSRAFTYLLPMEIWICVGILFVIGLLWWQQRNRKNFAIEDRDAASGAKNT
jgi:hypothetical protein